MLLNNQWITEEIQEEIKKKKFLEANGNKDTTIQNLRDVEKAVLERKFIAIQTYLRKKKNLKQPSITPKAIRKEEQNPKLAEVEKS